MRHRPAFSGVGTRALGIALLWSALAIVGTSNATAAQLPVVHERLRVVDSTRVQMLTMRDGSRLVGRITSMNDSALVFQASANTLTLAITEVEAIHEMAADEHRRSGFWFPHPNQTNLILGPTGRTLPRGDGYFSLHELFFPTLNYGITDHVTIGGGTTFVPGIPLEDQVMYLLPKVGVIRSPQANVAVGALVLRATNLFAGDGSADPFGIAYGVATFGGPDANITTGIGFPFYGSELGSRPLVQFGGQLRFGARGALISENWAYHEQDETVWISWTGIRFLAQSVSFDVAIAFVPVEAGWLPWVGIAKGF